MMYLIYLGRCAALIVLFTLAQPAGAQEATLDVRVTDSDSCRGLPCRLTIVDERGALAPLSVAPAPRLAVRPGVVYSADGRARIGLRPGPYTIHAA